MENKSRRFYFHTIENRFWQTPRSIYRSKTGEIIYKTLLSENPWAMSDKNFTAKPINEFISKKSFFEIFGFFKILVSEIMRCLFGKTNRRQWCFSWIVQQRFQSKQWRFLMPHQSFTFYSGRSRVNQIPMQLDQNDDFLNVHDQNADLLPLKFL